MCNKGHKCSNHKCCCCGDISTCGNNVTNCNIQCHTKVINKTPVHVTHHKYIEREIINPPIVKHIYDCARDKTNTTHRVRCSSKRCTSGMCCNKFNNCKYIRRYFKQTSHSSSISSVSDIKCSKYLCTKGRCVTHNKNCKYVIKYLIKCKKTTLCSSSKCDSSDCNSSNCSSSNCSSSCCNITASALQVYNSSCNNTKRKHRNKKTRSVFLKKRCTSD